MPFSPKLLLEWIGPQYCGKNGSEKAKCTEINELCEAIQLKYGKGL
jgi:hypothetical protein